MFFCFCFLFCFVLFLFLFLLFFYSDDVFFDKRLMFLKWCFLNSIYKLKPQRKSHHLKDSAYKYFFLNLIYS